MFSGQQQVENTVKFWSKVDLHVISGGASSLKTDEKTTKTDVKMAILGFFIMEV